MRTSSASESFCWRQQVDKLFYFQPNGFAQLSCVTAVGKGATGVQGLSALLKDTWQWWVTEEEI